MVMDKEVIPLSGEVVVDKSFDGETPVFERTGTILYLDDVSEGNLYAGAEVAFENPVPVYDDSDKMIGFADLSVSGKAVDAHCFLDYHTPERLSIETASEKIYPSLVAQEQLIEMDDGKWHVMYSLINSIQLLKVPQPDSRILPL